MSVIGNFLFIFFFTSLAFVYKRESRHSPSSKKLDSSQSLRPWTSGSPAPLPPCLPCVRLHKKYKIQNFILHNDEDYLKCLIILS